MTYHNTAEELEEQRQTEAPARGAAAFFHAASVAGLVLPKGWAVQVQHAELGTPKAEALVADGWIPFAGGPLIVGIDRKVLPAFALNGSGGRQQVQYATVVLFRKLAQVTP